MSAQQVRSPDLPASSRRERARIIALAGLIVGGIGLYLVLRASGDGRDSQRNLLPYQVLARSLGETDQQIFTDIRRGLLDAEAERSRASRWPDASELAERGIAPFAARENIGLRWQSFQAGKTTSYVAIPADPSAAAWMLVVKEPEPDMPPDPAPLDDEHHRLPDGTTLHIFVWTHRYGGRVASEFVAQPQAQGWVQVFSVPPNPLFLPKP